MSSVSVNVHFFSIHTRLALGYLLHGDPSKPGPSESGPSELLVTPVICVKTAERIITEPSPDLHLYLHLELSELSAACFSLYAAAVF